MIVLSRSPTFAFQPHLPQRNRSLKPPIAAINLSKHSKTAVSTTTPHRNNPFVPEVEVAVDLLQSEFRAVDNLVAVNTSRVLKAYQNARVGSHYVNNRSCSAQKERLSLQEHAVLQDK